MLAPTLCEPKFRDDVIIEMIEGQYYRFDWPQVYANLLAD